MSSAVEEIKRIFAGEKLNSTFLLVGPDRAEKIRLALDLAQGLICPNPVGNGEPCQKCGPCLRVRNQQSEALLILRLEKTQIKIEQAREIMDFLSLQSISRHRVIIIEEAESLNPAAANSLLKVLEEPPEKTVFLMIAPSPKHVLPTLRSRSMILTVPATNSDPIHNMDSENREHVNEIVKWWREDSQSYLRSAFRERVKDRALAQTLATGLQGHFRQIYLQHSQLESGAAEAWAPVAPKLFDLAISLERELNGSRDALMVFEEFWIRSHELIEAYQ